MILTDTLVVQVVEGNKPASVTICIAVFLVM